MLKNACFLKEEEQTNKHDNTQLQLYLFPGTKTKRRTPKTKRLNNGVNRRFRLKQM